MIDQCQTPGKAAAFIGIDWADREHAVCMLVDGHKTTQSLPHSAEEIAQWADMLHKRFGGRQVAVALEQSRGSLVHALMKFRNSRPAIGRPWRSRVLSVTRRTPRCSPGFSGNTTNNCDPGNRITNNLGSWLDCANCVAKWSKPAKKQCSSSPVR